MLKAGIWLTGVETPLWSERKRKIVLPMVGWENSSKFMYCLVVVVVFFFCLLSSSPCFFGRIFVISDIYIYWSMCMYVCVFFFSFFQKFLLPKEGVFLYYCYMMALCVQHSLLRRWGFMEKWWRVHGSFCVSLSPYSEREK